jgi:diaminohydroxyphosphoribosylaminopyrimidine deaminase/5-amino-6-(5-phosphoribosylamino)uracil reductase
VDNFTHVYVELKTAASLDGRFAPPPAARTGDRPVWLTSEDSRRLVHRRRRWCDLVLVGEGTVRADRPRLDGRLAADCGVVPAAEPAAGYVDTDLSWEGGFDRDRYLVFAGESARRSPNLERVRRDGGDVVFCRERDGRVDPRAVLAAAAERDLLAVMIEGGPTLASSFLAGGLVDRWLQFTAPQVLGDGVGWTAAGAPAADRPFTLTRHESSGGDALTTWDRTDFAAMLARVTV